MKYCRRHDLSFCPEHEGQCLLDDCVLEEWEAATFCSICSGILLPKNERPPAPSPAPPEVPVLCYSPGMPWLPQSWGSGWSLA
jgi:hypothetical protein